MREDKAKFTVKYNKSDNIVIGYFPNDINYANESFIDTNDIGYIEISKEEWEDRPKKAIVNGDILEEYVKPDSELLQEAKDNTIAKILINRNNWMHQTVTYKIDSKDTEFKATQIASLNLIAAARSPRNMSTGTINWLDNNDNPILLTIAQAEGIIDLIEDQRSYSYFRQATLNKEIESCNSISEIEQIDISF